MSSGKVIDGKLAVRDGQLACNCCGEIDDDLPDWVDPDPPGGGPNGPRPPTNPDGDPNCCNLFGAVCTTLGDDKVLLRAFVDFEFKTRFTYPDSEPASGVIHESENAFSMWLTDNEGNCSGSVQLNETLPTPFVLPDGTSGTKFVGLRLNNTQWNSRRGLWPQSPSIGINMILDNLPPAPSDRVTWNLARRAGTSNFSPLPDRVRYDRNQGGTIEEINPGSTSPSGPCANRLVGSVSHTFANGVLLNPTALAVEHTITMQLYAFAAYVTPCETV